MELNAEVRVIAGAHPLVCSVVQINEPGLPIRRQVLLLDGIAVVLARYIGASAKEILYRLVDAAVTVGSGSPDKSRISAFERMTVALVLARRVLLDPSGRQAHYR